MQDLTTGITHREEVLVTDELSPAHLRPIVVLSTPNMINLMELAATSSVQPYLGDERTTVGTHVDVTHEAAARGGETVTVDSELVEIDRRRLVFEVAVTVGARVIGRGRHERFIIDRDRFSG